MKPTYLYIKQHAKTGLKYFGKTNRLDPYSYKGSGIYWLRHIEKHGKEYVKTICCVLYYDREKLIEDALNFSIDNNIAASEEWANMIVENGINGGFDKKLWKGKKFTDEHRKNISIGKTGKKFSEEHKKNMSLAKRGKKHTEEHNKKIGLSQIGRKRSESCCRRISESKIGKKLSVEHRNAISLGSKNKKHSEITIKRMSASHRNKKLSSSHRENIGKSKKDTIWINDGKTRKRISKSETIPEGFILGLKIK